MARRHPARIRTRKPSQPGFPAIEHVHAHTARPRTGRSPVKYRGELRVDTHYNPARENPSGSLLMILEIGVRDLLAVACPSGDIQVPFRIRQLMQAGLDAHKLVRSARPYGYRSEVPVSGTVETPDGAIRVHGRIDGVLEEAARTLIEEIKATTTTLAALEAPESSAHEAQARIYGFLYADAHRLDRVAVALTYYSLADRGTKTFERIFDVQELCRFFRGIVEVFLELRAWEAARRAERDRSLAAISFPFPSLRPGQEELSAAVDRAVRDGERLIVSAATGIGKTMAVLHPAVRSLAEGHAARLFYLTARGTGQEAAEKALALLRDRGARLRSVTLTAKAKICLLGLERCRPEGCPYAKGYYDRVGDALREARPMLGMGREEIAALARRHALCPFELSLDLSLSADCIVGDYNYLFDPRVRLQRFFAEPRKDSVFLLDEAHNLIERVRAMHSARIGKKDAAAAKRLLDRKRHQEAYRAVKEIGDWISAAGKLCREEGLRVKAAEDYPAGLKEAVEKARDPLARVLFAEGSASAPAGSPILLDFYDRLGEFLQAAESYGGTHATVLDCAARDAAVTLLCLDPSAFIRQAVDIGKAAVFFSATLAPREYFGTALRGDPDDTFLEIPSPFPPENLCARLDASVSTRAVHRSATMERVVDDLAAFTRLPGHYMAFFPSYAYMGEALRLFRARSPEARILVQEPAMTEAAREAFLAAFREEPTDVLAGFSVLGGIFAEGIDLMGESLSGVAVVGVGLPAVTPERELIRGHLAARLGDREGFAHAYSYPGLTRVLQAAGRLLRSETDRGALLLIDDRYANDFYRPLLPPQWGGPPRARGPREIETAMERFRSGSR
jgi:DNA excision repair protein ERCC-2